MSMISYRDNTIRIRKFIRHEYFEPDISRALLIAVALVVPFGVFYLLGQPEVGSFVSVTAQLIASAKVTGTYPQRATILLTGTLAVALAAFVGTLAGQYLLTAILFMALVAGCGSLARSLGDYGTTLGITATLLFLLSLHAPNHLESAWQRALLALGGGCWASALALFYWPLRPYRPFYLAVAKPWEISGELMHMAGDPGSDDSGIQNGENSLHQSVLQVFPLLRHEKPGAVSVRREILKIARAASRFGATAAALHSELASIQHQETYRSILPVIRESISAISQAAASLTDTILYRRKKEYLQLQDKLLHAISSVTHLNQIIGEMRSPDAHPTVLLSILTLLESAIRYLQNTLTLLNRMEKKKSGVSLIHSFDLTSRYRAFRQQLRMQLQPNSLLLRHSLRVSLVAAVGITLYYWFDIPRGYWIVLTSLVVLQPDFGTTRQKALHRVIGTIIGVIIGTLLLRHPFHASFLVVAIACCGFLFAFYQSRNYKVAVVFVTIMLVAMLDVSGQLEWHIAAYRLLATVIGGLLSVVAAYTLWPSWEKMQFPVRLASAIRANRNFLLQIGHELRYQTGFHPRVLADQRKAEAENNNTLESLKRMNLEPSWKRIRVREAQTLAYHNNKLTRELIALAAFLPGLTQEFTFPEANATIDQCAEVLLMLSNAIEKDQPFENQPDFRDRIARMHTRIEQMHELEEGEVLPRGNWLRADLIRSHLERIILVTEDMARLVPQLNNPAGALSQTQS